MFRLVLVSNFARKFMVDPKKNVDYTDTLGMYPFARKKF